MVNPELLAGLFWSSQTDQKTHKNIQVQEEKVKDYVRYTQSWPQILMQEKTLFAPMYVDGQWMATCLWYNSLKSKCCVRVYEPKPGNLTAPRACKSYTHIIHISYICYAHIIHISYVCYAHIIHISYICYAHSIHISYILHTYILQASPRLPTRIWECTKRPWTTSSSAR